MNDEFPKFVGENDEVPPQIAAIVGRMFAREEGPDSQAYEWRVVLVDLRSLDAPTYAQRVIAEHLNEGFSLKLSLADIQKDFLFWAGARLRKPEGE